MIVNTKRKSEIRPLNKIGVFYAYMIFINMKQNMESIRRIIKEELTQREKEKRDATKNFEGSDEIKELQQRGKELKGCFIKPTTYSEGVNCNTDKLQWFYDDLQTFIDKLGGIKDIQSTPVLGDIINKSKFNTYKTFDKHLNYVHKLYGMEDNINADERGDVKSGKELNAMAEPAGYLYHGSTVGTLTPESIVIDSEDIEDNVLERAKRSGMYITFGFKTAADYATRWFFDISQGRDAREKYVNIGSKIWCSLDEEKKRHLIFKLVSRSSIEYNRKGGRCSTKSKNDEGGYSPTNDFLIALGALKSGKNPTVYKVKLSDTSRFKKGGDTVVQNEKMHGYEKDVYTMGGIDGLWMREGMVGSPDGEVVILNKDAVQSIEPLKFEEFGEHLDKVVGFYWSRFNDAKKVLKYLGS